MSPRSRALRRPSAAERLSRKIESRRAHLGVIGLGYVGLPLAVEFGRAGFQVTGIDIDKRRVHRLERGESYIQDVPTSEVRALVRAGNLKATSDFSVLRRIDAVNVCVTTPLSKQRDPDVSYIVAAAKQVATYLHPGMLVILESTTYPGTTDELVLPLLTETGLKVGKDFFLAFSPERVDPGNPQFNTKNIPKVVGGVTPACSEVAVALYRQRLEKVVPVSSTQVAEMVKLLENTFRSVNIGLVNELALMCSRFGIDVWEVIRAAATKPFGFMPFYPGPGLGGHCLPSDPYYLSWKVRLSGYEPRFIAFADEINTQMPAYVVHMVTDALNDLRRSVRDSRILALGVAYKPNVADTRDSPALEIIDLLIRKGALVSYHDPFVPSVTVNGTRLDCVAWPADVAAYDAVVVLTAHAGYDWPAIVGRARLVLDTRNATKDVTGAAHLIRL